MACACQRPARPKGYYDTLAASATLLPCCRRNICVCGVLSARAGHTMMGRVTLSVRLLRENLAFASSASTALGQSTASR